MYTQAYVQRPGEIGHYENILIDDSAFPKPAPQPQPQVIKIPEVKHNSHPLLIAGVVIGLFVGLIAALPKAIRGWVVLGIIVGIVWFGWRAVSDVVQQEQIGAVPGREPAYVLPEDNQQPVPSPTVEVQRAELVRMPARIAHK